MHPVSTARLRLCAAPLLLTLLLSASASVHARGHDDDDRPQGPVRCESHANKTEQCAIDGRARLVRQLSVTKCVEDRNWGQARGAVWVTDGCRAEFVVERQRGGGRWHDHDRDRDWDLGREDGTHGKLLSCESFNLREKRCEVRVRRGVQLVKQKSATRCRQDRNWGWDRRGVWVSDGCRAEFRVY